MHSPDLSQQNVEKLKELFPDCVTESRDENGKPISSIDFDLLKQELSDHVVEGSQERYRIDWPGKREAVLIGNAPIAKTLRPVREESVDFDNTKNLFIEGDNLAALKLLQETYLNKVKMIYIDPPYNDDKDLIYKDNYVEDAKSYLRNSNQVDEEGNQLVANTETNGRFHSDWLSMMYPRLKLARNLLRDDGVIFISIDDKEQANLKRLCDEVFGEKNHLTTMYIQVRFPEKTLAEKNDYQKLIETLFVYQKYNHTPIKSSEEYKIDKFHWEIREMKKPHRENIGGKKVDIFYKTDFEIKKIKPQVDALKETWASGTVLKTNASGKYFGKFLAPRKNIDGLGTLYKVYGIGEDGLGYRYFTGPLKAGATKGKFYSGVPLTRKDELSKGQSLKEKPILNFYDFAYAFGNCRLEGDVDFRSGKKPLDFLKTLLKQSTVNDELVLDFFAGSASTAHAVMQLNAEDGGKRQCISVQLPELIKTDSDAYKAGYKNIAEISKERIRRAGKKIKEENPDADIDIGFRVLKVDTSNMEDVYYFPDEVDQADLLTRVDNIKPDRTTEDLLFQVLLDWGVDLTLPIVEREISGKTVYFVDENALVACFDEGIDETFINEVAEIKPLRVVFRDSGFASDAVKINVTQIFKLISPDTDIRTI